MAAGAYDTEGLIHERHRHRYEVNNDVQGSLRRGWNVGRPACPPTARLVEIMEYEGPSFMVGVQFHPEFRSRPDRPHPLFREFVRAASR